MIRVDPLTNFTQQTLQDSQKAITALNAEQIQIRKVVLLKVVLDILTAAQGGTCAIIHTQCCTYIPDMSTNVTYFTKHMNMMIQAIDIPEVSVPSLWGMLTSSPWWKSILIVIILIVLFLLFASFICNCVAGLVYSCMEAFKLQMVVQIPTEGHSFLQLLLGASGSETLNMRVWGICCLTNLGTMPLITSEAVMEWEGCPFP